MGKYADILLTIVVSVASLAVWEYVAKPAIDGLLEKGRSA